MLEKDPEGEGETPEQAADRWGRIYWKRLSWFNWAVAACFLPAAVALLLDWVVVMLVLMILGAVVFVVLIPGPFLALRQKKKYRSMIPR